MPCLKTPGKGFSLSSVAHIPRNGGNGGHAILRRMLCPRRDNEQTRIQYLDDFLHFSVDFYGRLRGPAAAAGRLRDSPGTGRSTSKIHGAEPGSVSGPDG